MGIISKATFRKLLRNRAEHAWGFLDVIMSFKGETGNWTTIWVLQETTRKTNKPNPKTNKNHIHTHTHTPNQTFKKAPPSPSKHTHTHTYIHTKPPPKK